MDESAKRSRDGVARPRVLLVTPLAPDATGNGLAMRAGLLVDGLARAAELVVAVHPVADPTVREGALRWAARRSAHAFLGRPQAGADAVRGWLASGAGRDLVSKAEPLPIAARSASPTAGGDVVRHAGGDFAGIVVMRGCLAGIVGDFAQREDRPALLLDLDEDDEATLDSIGRLERERGEDAAAERTGLEARAYGRFLDAVLPWFDRVLVATESERIGLVRRRATAHSQVLPNAVPLPTECRRKHDAGGGPPRILFVGNFDYLPNRDALERLVHTVLPAIRRSLPAAELHAVGAGVEPRLDPSTGVFLHGRLESLAEAYASATLTVVPLRAGGGSRVKLLEAFAEGLPVVATPEAAAGLDVENGRELVLETDDFQLAQAAVDLARAPTRASELTRNALAFVAARHDRARIVAQLSSLCAEWLERRPVEPV